MNLTEESIKTAQPGDVLRDQRVRGLHLRVFSSGKKSFYLYFRTKAGRERKPKLGDYPSIKLGQARQIAQKTLGAVAEGKDPAAEIQASRAAPAVSQLCQRYEKEYLPSKKASGKKKDAQNIARFIKPRLGKLLVREVEYEHIQKIHSDLKSTPVQANRVLALLSVLFNQAEQWHYRPQGTNPCRHVKRYREKKRRRYMTAKEAYIIARRLKRYASFYPESVLFIYMLIYSGARPDEVARAKWADYRKGRIVLAEHKTDGAMDYRTVYLPPQVDALIASMPMTTGTIVGIKSPKYLWNRLRRKTGITDLRLYDLRHSFASAALAAGYTLSQIGELLGHQNTQTTARYAHLIDDAAEMAAAETGDFLERMMERA